MNLYESNIFIKLKVWLPGVKRERESIRQMHNFMQVKSVSTIGGLPERNQSIKLATHVTASYTIYYYTNKITQRMKEKNTDTGTLMHVVCL